jgi:hypothetical protein
MMDGAHTHGHGPSGLAELVAIGAAVVLAAEVIARVLTVLLIGLAVTGGVLVLGLAAYVVTACRRYKEAERLDAAPYPWPVVPGDPARPVLDDPVPLRQAITELHAQLMAARAGLPPADGAQHQHLHLHGLTPEQAIAIIAHLHAQQDPPRWQDGGSP